MIELPSLGGLSMEEIAEVLKVSPITVMQDWTTDSASDGHILATGGPMGTHIWRFRPAH